MDIIINDEYIEETTHTINGVVFRNEELDEVKNKFELLWKTVKYITGKSLNSPLLTITGNKQLYRTCICSCNKCVEVYFVKDEETLKEFAVGSSCVKKFNNDRLNTELYYRTKARRCLTCNCPMVIRDNDIFPINAKRGDYWCIDCKTTRIYINVPYKDKDNAKLYGAMWDSSNKKWYIHRNNTNYNYLVNKYK